jgi:hypothetical protein
LLFTPVPLLPERCGSDCQTTIEIHGLSVGLRKGSVSFMVCGRLCDRLGLEHLFMCTDIAAILFVDQSLLHKFIYKFVTTCSAS